MNALRINFHRRKSAALSGLILLLLASPATGLTQVTRERIKLNITIHAADDVNPSVQGQAAPIKVRVYELKSDKAFEHADFFTLHDNDKLVLGADLLDKEEFILRPGDKRHMRHLSNPATTAIGVLAAYRDLPNATWRAVYTLPPAPEAAWYRFLSPMSKAALNIALQTNDITITEIN